MSPALPRLTHRQQQVLDFIRAGIATNGHAPSMLEIGAHLGITSTNGVNDHLKALERKGALSRGGKGKARTLRPAPRSREQEALDHLRAMAGWVREDPICGVVAAALDHLIVLMTQRYPETT